MHPRRTFPILLVLLATVLAGPSARAASVYTGYDVSFERPAGLAGSDPAGWDSLTANVALARATTQGLFNAAVEASYLSGRPSDTEWATVLSTPGEAISAANYAALSFTSWESAFGGPGLLASNIVSMPAVVHLMSDDIYLDLRLTGWGAGSLGGGAFSYERSAIPEPTTGLLFAAGLAALAARRRA